MPRFKHCLSYHNSINIVEHKTKVSMAESELVLYNTSHEMHGHKTCQHYLECWSIPRNSISNTSSLNSVLLPMLCDQLMSALLGPLLKRHLSLHSILIKVITFSLPLKSALLTIEYISNCSFNFFSSLDFQELRQSSRFTQVFQIMKRLMFNTFGIELAL